jgi:hypothetical protein
VDLEHIDASRHQKSLSRIGGIEQQGEIRGWGGGQHTLALESTSMACCSYQLVRSRAATSSEPPATNTHRH